MEPMRAISPAASGQRPAPPLPPWVTATPPEAAASPELTSVAEPAEPESEGATQATSVVTGPAAAAGGAAAAEEDQGLVFSGGAAGSEAAAQLFELAARRVAGLPSQDLAYTPASTEEAEAALQLLLLAHAEMAAEDAAIMDEARDAGLGLAPGALAGLAAVAHGESTAAALRLIGLAKARVASRAGIVPSEGAAPASAVDRPVLSKSEALSLEVRI